MKSIKLLAAAAALTAGSAQAVTFTSAAGAPDPGASAGQALVVTFDAANAPGYTWTGGIQTAIGLLPNVAAAPAGDATRYGYVSSAVNPNNALLSTPALQSVSLYWGSIDSFNRLDVLDIGGNTLLSITGSMLPPATGDQGAGITNRRVFITAGAGESIWGLRFSSTGVAFEFDNIAALGAVPEPGTWAMMIAGFGIIGATMRRRRPATKISFA
jgi:PEP-CTERM motif